MTDGPEQPGPSVWNVGTPLMTEGPLMTDVPDGCALITEVPL